MMYDEPYTSNLLVFVEDSGGELLISHQCPHCGKFVTQGKVESREWDGQVRFTGWVCVDHGEISPYWTRM
jgi:hypothetical protein